MIVDDIRKLMEGLAGKLTPAKAQELARSLAGEDRREQATRLAQDMLEWQQRNLERVKEVVTREVRGQLKAVGVATQADVDALKKRVRALERTASEAKATASKPAPAAKAPGKPAARKPKPAEKTRKA